MTERMNELLKLLDIKSYKDIKSYEVIEEFEDDHLDCAIVEINGIEVEFLWYDDISPIRHPNRFKDMIVEIILDRVSTDIIILGEEEEMEYKDILNLHPVIKQLHSQFIKQLHS